MADEEKKSKKKKDKKEKKKHYWWRYLLVFLAGMITTVLVVVGGSVAATAVIPASTVITMLGGDPNKVLAEDYRNGTFFDLIMSVVNDGSNLTTIGGIAKYTPLIDEALNTLSTEINNMLGFELDIEELKTKQFEELGQYLMDEIMNKTTVSRIVGADSSSETLVKELCFNKNSDGTYDFDHPRSIQWFKDNLSTLTDSFSLPAILDVSPSSDNEILKCICYPKKDDGSFDYDNPRTVGALASGDTMQEIMESISLPTVLNVSSSTTDTMVKAICYPKTTSGEFDYDHPRTVGDLAKEGGFNEILDSITLADALGVDSTSDKMLKFFCFPKVGDEYDYAHGRSIAWMKEGNNFKNLFDSAPLGDIIDIPTDSVLYQFKDVQIKDAGDIEIGELTLTEVLGTIDPSNKVLYALRNTKINQLQSAIDDLTVGDLLDTTGSTLLTALAPYKLSELDDAINNQLTLGDLVDTSGSSILSALSTYTLSGLDDAIDDLTLDTLLGGISSSDKLLYALRNSTMSTISSDVLNVEIGAIIDPGDNPLLQAISGFTVGNLGTNIDSLTLGQILGSKITGNVILEALASSTLSTLNADLNNLTISQLLEGDPSTWPYFLQSISSCKLGEIDERLKGLKVSDVFAPDEINANPFLKSIDPNTLLGDIPGAINNLLVEDVFADSIYENPDTKTNPYPEWRYLLTRPGETEFYPYKVTEMASMMNNFTWHMKWETVQTLYNDHIISVESTAIFNLTVTNHVVAEVDDQGTEEDLYGRRYGDLTVSQFVLVASSFIH